MFRPMDPNVIRDLIAEQEDVIAKEIEEEQRVYENLKCPMCYEGGCERRVSPPKVIAGPKGEPVIATSPFVPGKALPQGYAHCVHCGTDFDPRTGFIRQTEASQVQPVDLDPASRISSPQSDPHLV